MWESGFLNPAGILLTQGPCPISQCSDLLEKRRKRLQREPVGGTEGSDYSEIYPP